MAKIIEGPGGARMLVSDDMPDDIDIGNEIVTTDETSEATVIDPVSVLLCFEKEEYPVVPVQANTYVVKKNLVKLSGVMLLADFAWLAENVDANLTHLEVRMDHRAFKVGVGIYNVEYMKAKDMNATTVYVHLSLKEHS